MKANVFVEIGYEIELPDDWCDRCRKMQGEMGENYIGKDWTNEEIFQYIAVVYGFRGIHWLESVGEEMSSEIKCKSIDTDSKAEVDFE